jgi:cytosine/adenosine deaminase-related metal-dependent hydrolase
LVVGHAADFVLFDVSGLDRAGALTDPLAALVFTGISHRVHAAVVNGRIVVENGRLATLDEEDIARRAHEASFALCARAGVPLRWDRPPWLGAARNS